MENACATNTNGDAVSDTELVRRSLSGEEDAFRQLHDRYRAAVYSAIYRIIRDPEETLDLTQEVFVSAYRSMANWDAARAAFFSWIYKMATNQAIDYWRIRRRRAEVPLPETSQTTSGGALPSGSPLECVERAVEYRELAAEMQRILRSMPFRHRRFLVLRYCDGLKLREIAEKEQCKIGTVKSVLHRGTAVIRFRLTQLSAQLYPASRSIPVQNPA